MRRLLDARHIRALPAQLKGSEFLGCCRVTGRHRVANLEVAIEIRLCRPACCWGLWGLRGRLGVGSRKQLYQHSGPDFLSTDLTMVWAYFGVKERNDRLLTAAPALSNGAAVHHQRST